MCKPFIAAVLMAVLGFLQYRPAHAQTTPFLRIEAGGHTARVMRLVFRTNTEFFSAGADRAVRVWRLPQTDGESVSGTAGAEQTRTLQVFRGAGQRGAFEAQALSGDGKLLVTAGFEGVGRDGRVRVFDLATGKVAQVWSHSNNGVADLQFSPDGKFAAGCSDRDNPVWLWDTQTGRTIWTGKKGFDEAVNRVAFSPDGRFVAAASDDKTVHVLQTGDGKEAARLTHESAVRSVVWSADGKMLASGTDGGIIRVFAIGPDGTPVGEPRKLPTQANAVLALAVTPNGFLISGQGERTDDFRVRVWNLATGAAAGTFGGHKNSVLALAVSPDGTRVASADYDGAVYVWRRDRPDGTPVALVPRAPTVHRLAWGKNPDRRILAYAEEASDSGTTADFRAFDMSSAAPASAPADLVPAQTEQNGKRLVIADDRLSVRVMEGGKEKLRLQLSEERLPVTLPGGVSVARKQDMDRENRVTGAVFAPDGRIVIGATFSLTVFSPDGKPQTELAGHTGEITALCVSPDGRYLASAGADHVLCLWPLDTKSRVQTPLVFLFVDRDSTWVAWTNEGYFAASPGGDSRIGWQVNRGEDEAADFYPAEAFWQRLYRPDILVRVAQTGSVAQAALLADAVRPKPGPVLEPIARIAPPQAGIVEPQEGAVFTSQTATLRVRVTDPNGRKITRLYAQANGAGSRDIGIEAVGDNGSGEIVTRTVSLQPGENVVTVVAENDAATQSAPARVHVFYRPLMPRKPSLYLLSVGISSYPPSPVYNPLHWADADASGFADEYLKQNGTLFDGVPYHKVLVNEQAKRGSLVAELQSLSHQSVHPEDYVVLFIAGHGGPVAPEKGDREYCFLTQDAQVGQLSSTALTGKDMLEILRSLPCNVVIFMDTCRAGSDVLRADDPDVQLAYLSGKINYGRVTVLSCGPGEVSLENAEWEHGAFTRTLLAGLRGAAKASGPEKTVTLLDLETYLAQEVRQLTGGKQNPRVYIPSYIGTVKAAFPIARAK